MICIASLLVHVLLVGLQHGLRGKDSDGDGVLDTEDRCPASASALHFYSSWRTDWDGDGCLDSVEDADDDDDNVLDSLDLCPRSPLGVFVDKDGCTGGQLELQRRGDITATHGSASLLNEPAWTADGVLSKVLEIFAEVVVGMMLTFLLTHGWDPMKAKMNLFKERLSTIMN